MSDTTSLPPAHRNVDAAPPPAERKTVGTLAPNDCRWPFGDPTQADFYFCGKKTKDGCTYCEPHRQIAFQSSKPRTTNHRPFPT